MNYNGTTLAYLGDAVYELYIRKELIKKGNKKAHTLHVEAITYTSASGQLEALDKIKKHLTEEELSYFKRGRNASNSYAPKSTDKATYQQATGLESLFGALHIKGDVSRIQELIDIIVQ